MSCKSAGRSRPRVRLKCGEDRFPKSKLDKLKLDLAMQAQEEHRRRPTRCSLDVDQETYGYSPKVLIHGWQKRLMQVNEILRRLIDIKRVDYAARIYRDCARCADLKQMSDWSPDIIIRRREHPTTIFQSPVPADLEKTRCLYAVQLKSWYDEQYNDWAKRYLREQLYNPDGIDLGAIYAYKNLLLKPPSSKKIAPRQVAEDEEYPTTECMPQNYGLLEQKQQRWRKDIDIMLGRRVPDTTHHHDFASAYRSAVRKPPAALPAACLRPRRAYPIAEKTLPCGEKELCILCDDPPIEDISQQDEVPSCVEVHGLFAV